MFESGKGAKGGKRDSKLLKLVTKKKNKTLEKDQQEKDNQTKQVKVPIISTNPEKEVITEIDPIINSQTPIKTKKEIKPEIIDFKPRPVLEKSITVENIKSKTSQEKEIVIPISVDKTPVTIKKNVIENTKQEPIEILEEKEKPIITNPKKEIEELTPIIKPKQDSKITEKREEIKPKKEVITPKEKETTEETPELQLKLIDELDEILKENRFELNKLITEYNILNKEADNLIETKDAEKASEEINELLDKLERIKKEMENMTNSSTLKNIYEFENHYLNKLLTDYKDSIKTNLPLQKQVEDIEKDKTYVSIVNKIIEFEQERNKLQIKVNAKKAELELRDDEFDKLKDNHLNIEKITKELDSIIKETERELDKIKDKVNASVKVTEIVETKMVSSLSIVTKALLLMTVLKHNPLRKANGLAALEALTAISLISNLAKPKKVTTTTITTDLVDYKNNLIDALKDTKNIDQLVDDSIKNISELKDTFEDEFKQYQYDIPEYDKVFSSLNKMEKELKEKKDNMSKINQELSYQYNKNDQKVKKYENIAS